MSQPNITPWSRFHRPGPGTPSVAWRLFWIWPGYRAAQCYLFFAVALGVFEALRQYGGQITQLDPMTWWTSFSGVGIGFVIGLTFLLLYTGPFGIECYAENAARPLAMLPVSRRRMALARWCNSIVAQPLLFLVVVAILMIALPYPLALRAWLLTATLVVVLLAVGAYSMLAAVDLARVRAKPKARREALLQKVDTWLPRVAALTTALGFQQAYAGQANIGLPCLFLPSVLSIIWSCWRMPEHQTPNTSPPLNDNGTVEFIPLRKMLWELRPSLFAMSIAVAVGLCLQMMIGASHRFGASVLLLIILGHGVATELKTKLRGNRVLPLSTGQLTHLMLLTGFARIFPVFGLITLLQGLISPMHDAPLYLLIMLLIAIASLTLTAVEIYTASAQVWSLILLIGVGPTAYGVSYFLAMRQTTDPLMLRLLALCGTIAIACILFAWAYYRLRCIFFWQANPYRILDKEGDATVKAANGDEQLGTCVLLGSVALFIACVIIVQ